MLEIGAQQSEFHDSEGAEHRGGGSRSGLSNFFAGGLVVQPAARRVTVLRGKLADGRAEEWRKA